MRHTERILLASLMLLGLSLGAVSLVVPSFHAQAAAT